MAASAEREPVKVDRAPPAGAPIIVRLFALHDVLLGHLLLRAGSPAARIDTSVRPRTRSAGLAHVGSSARAGIRRTWQLPRAVPPAERDGDQGETALPGESDPAGYYGLGCVLAR